MSQRPPMIHVRLHGRRDSFEVDLDFSIPGRGVTALLGDSGSGKTTILRAIAGFETWIEGRVEVGGVEWQGHGRRVAPHLRSVGCVFQEASLFPHLNVRGNLEFGWKRTPACLRSMDFDDLAAMLGLEPLLDRSVDRLSGGERQRVAIGRALLASPKLLLMDEPLASLDRRSRGEILPFLRRMHEALALPIVYVTHAFDEVAVLADHAIAIEAGRLIGQGAPGEVLTLFSRSLPGTEGGAHVVPACR